jgi:hypothetical protein
MPVDPRCARSSPSLRVTEPTPPMSSAQPSTSGADRSGSQRLRTQRVAGASFPSHRALGGACRTTHPRPAIFGTWATASTTGHVTIGDQTDGA